jgi:hypothetical protein
MELCGRITLTERSGVVDPEKPKAPVIRLRKVCKVCQPENIAKNVVNREIVALSV